MPRRWGRKWGTDAPSGRQYGSRLAPRSCRRQPRLQGPVRRRKVARRARLAREEDTAVDRLGEHAALIGATGQGMAVAALDPWPRAPRRADQRPQLPAHII